MQGDLGQEDPRSAFGWDTAAFSSGLNQEICVSMPTSLLLLAA